MSWSGDVVQLEADNPHLHWNLPTDGGGIWTDNMLIPKGGDVYTASVYMNYVYDPKVAGGGNRGLRQLHLPGDGAKDVLLKIRPCDRKEHADLPNEGRCLTTRTSSTQQR